ncbi:hypothetical protein [Carboxylicivirga sp. N1Y90]|uniref:hypothetical protein n=1 Tax=Carboxylicivirga fragile TaxID=3417571 RepID=UPI003D335094|nr:hypothetical protein [Marinilabiliaceae bacterium N1Y90]
MILKYSFSIIVLVLVSVNSIFSQEKINQDVRVVREYTPTVSDAYKVNQMPKVTDSITMRPKFNYRILSTSVSTNYEPSLISPAKIQAKRKQLLMKSFVKGGVGNYGTFLGEIGYNILESEPFLLGLNIGHTSSFGELKLENDETVKAPFNDTWANVGFKHFFNDLTLSVDLDFNHNMYRYYGLQTLDMEQDYTVPGYLTPLSGSQLAHDDKQRLSSFDMSVGLKNNVIDNRKTAYDASIGFNAFSNLTGVSQKGFVIEGELSHPLNNMFVNVDAKVESYRTSVPDSIGPMFHFTNRNITLIQATPSVSFDFDNARLKVGLFMAGIIDSEGDEFVVAPDIMGDLTVVEGIVSLYAGLNGRVNLNDYRSIMYENPFVSPDYNVSASKYGLNILAGIKGNFSSSTSFSAGVEYSFFNNEHFYLNKPYVQGGNPGSSAFTGVNYTNVFMPVYDDGTLLKVEGELLFRPKESIELLLNGAYYGWSLDTQEEAWHKPEVKFGLDGRWELFEDLVLSGGIEYYGERKVLDFAPTTEMKTLSSIIDVHIGGQYYFSKQWSFWANINNLAASKYYKWNGYPMQGLNAKAGILFSF